MSLQHRPALARRVAPVVALCMSAVACTPQPTVDVGAARAALEEADRSYAQATLAKDRTAFLGFYAPEAVMYPPGEARVTGLEAIGALADTFWRDPAFAGSFRPITIEMSADGTMGYTVDALDLTMTGADGAPVAERFRDIHVWRRLGGGGWKITMDTWNAEPPAAGGTP